MGRLSIITSLSSSSPSRSPALQLSRLSIVHHDSVVGVFCPLRLLRRVGPEVPSTDYQRYQWILREDATARHALDLRGRHRPMAAVPPSAAQALAMAKPEWHLDLPRRFWP